MAFTQEPFPDELSQRTLAEYGAGAPMRHHSVIREWVERIFSRGGLEGLLELNTTVERVEKVGGEWVLTLRKESGGRNYWWREEFDAVVVSTGHYHVPWFPDIPGLFEYEEKFPGSIVHSKHFRTASQFKDKVRCVRRWSGFICAVLTILGPACRCCGRLRFIPRGCS